MIPWSSVGKVVVIAGIFGAVTYAIHGSGYSAGVGDGREAGYKAGYQAAMKLADSETLRLLAERNVAALKAQKERDDQVQKALAEKQAEIDAARADARSAAARARADRDAVLDRVRESEGRIHRLARQLSEADGAASRNVSAEALSAAIRRLARAVADAEELNIECKRFAVEAG